MASWHCRIVDITLSFLLNYAPVCQARGLGGYVSESVDFTCSWCVFFNGRGAIHKLSPSGLPIDHDYLSTQVIQIPSISKTSFSTQFNILKISRAFYSGGVFTKQNVLPISGARAYTVSDDASADQRYSGNIFLSVRFSPF